MRLLLVRHAESFGNQARQIQGQTDDRLTPIGCQQAHQLGCFLRQASWRPSHIYTSPLPRALQTATILQEQVIGPGDEGTGTESKATENSVPLQTHPALQEIHNGILQGLTWETAQQQYPELCQQLISTPIWQAIPGAETPSQVQARAKAFVGELLRQHHNADQVWVVTHGGLLLYLLAQLLETVCVWDIQIPLTAIFEIEIDLDHWPQRHRYALDTPFWRIHRFNEMPHLSFLLPSPELGSRPKGRA
jgi:2,3-bisphosphoglycerate-dependent phosphoglycerate mutase